MSKEQFEFNFEPKDTTPPEPSKSPEIKYNVAERDECDYCGAPLEGKQSCQYCQGNPTKRAFLKNKN